MNVYHYNSVTKEYVGISQANESPLEPGEYLIPANSTTIAPQNVGQNQVSVYESGVWSIKDDYRGTKYYKKSNGEEHTITEINDTVPSDSVTTAPTQGLFKPSWNVSVWEETALIYKTLPVETKAQVDAITRDLIVQLEEEKVKTELLKAMVASQPIPQIWTNFVSARDQLVQDGNTFISNNNLT